MATAYSTLLGLALPVQGELSGTWGDMVDNGITRYVDIAVAGTVTLTNDGAVTLSLTNGDSSATNIVSSLTGAGTVSAQFAIIKVTGTLTTAKVLTPPSSSRTYVVVNAATGSTVTVKASGQTGVSIAVGETAFVYFNGTDYVKVAGTVNTGVTSFQTSLSGLTPSTSTTGAVTLAGTLGTSSGGTNLTSFTSGGVVYASSSSALATGSALVFDGTNLFNTGSLFLGTVTAPFTSGEIYFANQKAIRWRNAANSGYVNALYVDASNNLQLGAGTSDAIISVTNLGEAMRIVSTTGNVGIGTSSPTTKLTVINTSDANKQIVFGDSATYYGSVGHNSGTGANEYRTEAAPYGKHCFYKGTSSTADLTLDSAGNLGLGVTPSAWLASRSKMQFSSAGTTAGFVGCYDGSGANNQMGLGSNCYLNASSSWIYSNSGGAGLYAVSNNIHSWNIAASGTAGAVASFTQAMTLDASGNLGIGTSSPSQKLHVASTSNAQGLFATSGAGGGSNRSSVILQGPSNTWYINTNGSDLNGSDGALGFYGNSATRMVIDTSGNVGIGTTSPASKLDVTTAYVDPNATAHGTVEFNSNSSFAINKGGSISLGGAYTGTSTTQYGSIIGAKENGTDGNYAGYLAFQTRPNGSTSVERARISSTGGFSVGTTADPGAGAIYATGNITAYYSDKRLKTVSGKIENALDKVAQLSGVYYTNNSVAKSFGYDSDEVQVGVLAQDVEAVLPQIVKAAPFDLDENGNSKSGENYKTVQYERLVPLLIEAINELRAEVKALKGA